MYGVQKQQLRKLTKKEYLAMKEMCHLAKNMYNVGVYNVRQLFFKEGKYCNYYQNNVWSKNNENYKLLNAGAAQQLLMKVDENFKSFFESKKKGNKPRLPGYLPKDGYFELSFPQIKIQRDDTFFLPMSPAFKREYGKVNIHIPSNLKGKKIREVRIHPRYNAHIFELEYVYEVEKEQPKLSKHNLMSIDLGINNFVSAVTTTGASFLVDGKPLKSVNQWYNKRNSYLQSMKDKQGLKVLTKKQIKLIEYRNHYVNDYMNKTVRIIIDACIKHEVGCIVVGYNKGWKQKINIGKANNQKFTSIPHGKFLKKLTSMCERYGIELSEQEEAYTSKASFLDQDIIPAYDEKEKRRYHFKGKRTKRGLYKSSDGIQINADINGAANILVKSGLPFEIEKMMKAVKQNPTKIKLPGSNKKHKPKVTADLRASA